MAKLNTITASTPLTVAQAAVLQAAASRQDGAVILPARLKGRAASTLVASLIAKGLVREARAKAGLPAWRQDAETGKSHALVITKAGRAAALAPESGAEKAAAEQGANPVGPAQVGHAGQRSEMEISKAGSSRPVGNRRTPACRDQPLPLPTPKISAPRPATKLSGVIALLEREAGATIGELTAATGWLPHTTRAALTGLRKRGLAVATERQHGAETTYRIQPAPAAQVA